MRLLYTLCFLLVGCNRGPKTVFDGERALSYVKTQLDFGPRVPGTPPHVRTGDWIIAQMKQRADTVVVQSFTHVRPSGQKIPMRNILARFKPALAQRVLYVTHWDTRPISDDDVNLGFRNLPILGANDGASGVALLIALGDALKKTPPNVGVDLLFVDGEDLGSFDAYSDTAADPDVLVGSTYFARHLPSPDYKPLYGVLWDMIGDKDLDIYEEVNSLNAAPEVVQRVWGVAADLGYAKYFIPQPKEALIDDHLPLLKQGLRVIDVIDIDYCANGVTNCQPKTPENYHHTQQDTFDKVSAHSLQVVGDVATALVTR